MNVNQRARAKAQAAGRDTFRYEVVDYWTACTTCGEPIRRNVDGPPSSYDGRPTPGSWRTCGCPGVLWTLNLGSAVAGWQKASALESTP